jgi:phage internal scaffolding protein
MTKKTEKLEVLQRTHRPRSQCPTIDTGEGLTEQSHKQECDINYILKDYARTGFIKHANQNAGQYDDVTSVDFQTAMDTVANVKSMFENLPSQVRAEFQNEPTRFLDYVQNPANAKALEQRGILHGNDGIDIRGAYTAAPTESSLSAAEVSSAPESEQPSASAE